MKARLTILSPIGMYDLTSATPIGPITTGIVWGSPSWWSGIYDPGIGNSGVSTVAAAPTDILNSLTSMDRHGIYNTVRNGMVGRRCAVTSRRSASTPTLLWPIVGHRSFCISMLVMLLEERFDTPWRSTACGPLIFGAVPRVFYTQTSLAEYTDLCYLDGHRGGGRYGSHEYRFG